MRFAHTNIVAGDWRKLADFYIAVFDCRIKPPERRLSGDWLDRGTGLSNARLEGVHLLLPGYPEDGPTLEIFTYEGATFREIPMADHSGFSHIAFEVESVTEVFNAALENGGAPLGAITERAVEGVGMLTFVYLRDPEGNIIEVQSWDS